MFLLHTGEIHSEQRVGTGVGAGTTGLAALALGRRYVRIDINPAYHDLAKERLMPQTQNVRDSERRAV